MHLLISGDALVRMTRATKLCADALVPALVLMACSASADPGSSASAGVSASAASATGSPGAAGAPGEHGSPGTDADAGALSIASCSESSCSVTLAGTGSRVQVLGTTIAFEDVRDGRATLRVDDQTITCTEGQSAPAGPVTLTCTEVTSDAVTVTVSPA